MPRAKECRSMSDVLARDSRPAERKSWLEQPPFDRPALTIRPVQAPATQAASANKPALVELIYDHTGRVVATVVIGGGSPDLYSKLYGMLPEGARSMPLLAKAWRVFAVLAAPAWAEAKQYTQRPKGTPIEL